MTLPHTILVVGGGRGIGLEITKAILKFSPRAHVFVFSFHIDKELTALAKESGRIFIFKGDITVESTRKQFFAEYMRTIGFIDTLVFTAGVITPIQRIEKLDLEDVKRTFDVNVFGCIAMCQLFIPYLRASRARNSTNAAYGKAIILSSVCDKAISYHGWMPYCTTKAALTRFIEMLAHEEPLIAVQGVYPKLTRTKMADEIIAGKYEGIMATHEIEKFRSWNEAGDEMVEPPEWCGEAVAKLAVGLAAGGKSGETLGYDVHVPARLQKT